jgi:hypothetical protein
MNTLRWLCGVLLVALVWSALFATAALGQTGLVATPGELGKIIDSMRTQPMITTQGQYIMTARVRILFFWAGKDDVGSARIRRGSSSQNPDAEWIDLVAGSDPEKAPRAINRWGSARESFTRMGRGVETSTFFGFMKVSQGSSTAEMEEELAREKENREFLFSAILDQSGHDSEFVKLLPFTSDQDYSMKDLDQVAPSVLDRLAGPQGRVKTVDAGRWQSCERAAGFLSTVSELIADAMANPKQKRSLCYLYNGERRTLTLVKATPVGERTIELSLTKEPKRYVRSYRDLLLAEMKNENQETGKSSTFRLLLGTKGDWKGFPVQISYQPNWWFQVVLNLRTPEPAVSVKSP